MGLYLQMPCQLRPNWPLVELLLQTPNNITGADSRFAPSQWETSLQSNDVSDWLGANLESALCKVERKQYIDGSMQVFRPLTYRYISFIVKKII